jgi:hypothetical protein
MRVAGCDVVVFVVVWFAFGIDREQSCRVAEKMKPSVEAFITTVDFECILVFRCVSQCSIRDCNLQ